MTARIRHGMTLVEMLVATTMTLIIMGIVAQLFGFLAGTLSRSRDTFSMSADTRSVANLLRRDLAGLTARTLPPLPADADAGYLEIIEGVNTDRSAGFGQLAGDCDDGLMLTTRSLDRPFVGRFGSTGSIESPVAEVAWFCLPAPTDPRLPNTTLYNLYRRQLLVMDYVGQTPFESSLDNSDNSIAGTLPNNDYDISLRADRSTLRPNSLGDLTRREWRFLHSLSGSTSQALFPYNTTAANLAALGTFSGARQGEDIVLTNVLAFDIRVFDPRAPIKTSTTTAVDPSDPGYGNASLSGVTGAYVDLGSGTVTTDLLGAASAKSRLTRIYDTWSNHYEFNGINEDFDSLTDEGTNGVDDDGDGVVDDADEQETSPPYPVPLRGIEVRIRVYEPSSRQVRQVTVRHTFVPH
jgi:hypothetical protein